MHNPETTNMTNTKILYSTIALISLLGGYLLGNFFPLRNFSSNNQTSTDKPKSNNNSTTTIPSGKGILEVIVKNSSNEPMIGIEIDVSSQPGGQPESWGIKEADVNGKTNFELAPGTYYIYFNLNRFPSGYKSPSPQKADIQEGQTKSVTIILERN